jgi:NTP pyrophosphatase (non-canonical NTP hydrolase)
MINELAQEIHKNAVSKGFYEEEKDTATWLMLIVTEVAEACEADRKDHFADWEAFDGGLVGPLSIRDRIGWVSDFDDYIKDSFEDELADIMIRVMDLAAHKGIDLETHIRAKMHRNSLREYKHGKKY